MIGRDLLEPPLLLFSHKFLILLYNLVGVTDIELSHLYLSLDLCVVSKAVTIQFFSCCVLLQDNNSLLSQSLLQQKDTVLQAQE